MTLTNEHLPAPARRLVIAVATYRRPHDIRRCVEALTVERAAFLDARRGQPTEWRVRLLVVDNDAEGGAEAVLADRVGPELQYVIEPAPGISAARNRALAEAVDDDVLVFVDDDEEPRPGWLEHLVAAYERSDAAAVAGRVVSAFNAPLDPWIKAGRFFERRTLPTGTPITVAATNNLLLDLAVVRRHELRFADAFGLSGGGDSDFTRRLVRLGEPMIWCDEAVVVDHVPDDRATREWVLGRARRTGNSEVVVGLRIAAGRRERARERLRAVVRGGLRFVGGTIQFALGRLTGSITWQARGAKARRRGHGMLLGATGRTVAEYRRDTGPLRVLVSFPPPGPRTNPYIAQLAAALKAEPGIEVLHFSWRTALLGRYDLVHLHWPEILVRGASPVRALSRQLRLALLLARWRLTGTPIVRTLHNVRPHDGVTPAQRRLLALVDRLTVAAIALNPVDVDTQSRPTTLIPHGHYVDWATRLPAARRAAEPGHIVFAGLIRPYKNVPALIAAFRDLPDPAARLHVAGEPAGGSVADELQRAAAGDDRITLDLRFLEDDELAGTLARAALVALPYQEMHNSGAALLALSLARPVLLPDNAVNRELRDEVGARWVQLYRGRLTGEVLADALAAVADRAPEDRPDLGARHWTTAGARHLEVYRTALDGRSKRVGA